jgi:hypothetical protein
MIYSLSLKEEDIFDFVRYILDDEYLRRMFRGASLLSIQIAPFRLIQTSDHALKAICELFYMNLRDKGYGYTTRGNRDYIIKRLFNSICIDAPIFGEELKKLVFSEPKLEREVKKVLMENKLG